MQVETTRTYSRWYWFKWRIATRFFPTPPAVPDAWYAQDCPPWHLFVCPRLTLRERINWTFDKWLRECHKAANA